VVASLPGGAPDAIEQWEKAMTMTEQGPRTEQGASAVVGVFDEIGDAEHAVRRLHEVGLDRDAVVLGLERVEAEQEETPAPPSLALPYAFVCSLLGGAACGLLAAFFAPSTVTIQGFGWTVPTVLTLSLVGGAFGWMLGAILGYGDVSKREREDVPALVPITEPVATVTVRSPGRPEEVRTILRSIGAREVRGGDTVRPDLNATRQAEQHTADLRRDTGSVRPLPRAGGAIQATGTGQSVRVRITRGRARPPISGQGVENKTTLAIGIAVVTGAVLGLLGRRKKE